MAASGWLLAVLLAVSTLLIHSMAADDTIFDTDSAICALPTATTTCAIDNSYMHGKNLYRLIGRHTVRKNLYQSTGRHTVHLTPARERVNERECGPLRVVKREGISLISSTGSIADFQHLHTESLNASTPTGESTGPRCSDCSQVVRKGRDKRESPQGAKTKERVDQAPEKPRKVAQEMTEEGMRGVPEDPADEGLNMDDEAALPYAGQSFNTQRGAGYEADNPEGLQPLH